MKPLETKPLPTRVILMGRLSLVWATLLTPPNTQSVINGIGIAGLTAKQTVALINVAGGGDVGTALLTSFGPDYLEKGFENLGVDTSFYTNMSQPVKDGFNTFLTERLDGKSFSDCTKSWWSRVLCRIHI